MRENVELTRLRGRLEQETIFLEKIKKYGRVTFDEENCAWVYVTRFPIGEQWFQPHVGILIDIPTASPTYPVTAVDWFWVDKDLQTREGQKVNNFFDEEKNPSAREYVEKGWGHFCFHIKSWHPITNPRKPFTHGDSLVSYLNAVSIMFHGTPGAK